MCGCSGWKWACLLPLCNLLHSAAVTVEQMVVGVYEAAVALANY